MSLENKNFRVSVREIHLTTVPYPSLPLDLKLHSCSHVKLDKQKHLRIFFREQTYINSRVDKMSSQITPIFSFYDTKITS